MKEKIYTIPISEALEQECFCPFCYTYKRLEQEAVEYTLGPAMMEPDFRMITNAKGFCNRHMRDLHGLRNALSLALVADTHIDTVLGIFDGIETPEKKAFFKKEKSKKDIFVENLKTISASCAICDKIEDTFSKYFETFVFTLKTEKDFLDKVLACEGFCTEHFARLAEVACQKLSDPDFEKLFVPIILKQKKRTEKYHADIKKFEENFDYRNAGKPSQVPRDTLVKTGFLLNGEFEPKE